MRGNPILNSLRTAEAAGYPALLVVAAVCLGLVVGPVALLGLTHAIWVLVLALLYLIVAIVVLSVAVGAALSEGDAADAEGQEPRGHASDKRSPSEHEPTADRRLGTSASIGGPGARSQPSRSLTPRRRPSALPPPVTQVPAGGAPRRSAPDGPERVPAADGPPADELAVAGAEPGGRGAPTSLPGDGPRVGTPRGRRAMRGSPGRRSVHRD
jgi:hypothetical protein